MNNNTTLDPQTRAKALQAAIGTLDKRFGKRSVMRMGEVEQAQCEVVSSGCLSLDLALGVGGYAKGRVVEIYGPEASGKTTLTLHAIAESQKVGGTAAFIDAEHALDVSYAAALGVDVDALLVSQPDNGEQALEIAETLVRSGAVDLVVIDSVAALVPRAEIEGDMGDAHMGLQARLMSQALRKITGITHKTGCTVIFINQVRQKIGVTFGNGETTTGGNALKFYASQRIDIRRIGSIKSGNEVLGNRVRIKVVKNKLDRPFRTVEADVVFGRGLPWEAALLDLAEQYSLVEKSGAWYTMPGECRVQGREAAKAWLLDNPEAATGLDRAVRGAAGLVREEAAAEA